MNEKMPNPFPRTNSQDKPSSTPSAVPWML